MNLVYRLILVSMSCDICRSFSWKTQCVLTWDVLGGVRVVALPQISVNALEMNTDREVGGLWATQTERCVAVAAGPVHRPVWRLCRPAAWRR